MKDTLIDKRLFRYFFTEKTSKIMRRLSSKEIPAIKTLLTASQTSDYQLMAVQLFQAVGDSIRGSLVINAMISDYLQRLTSFEDGIIHLSPKYRSHLLHSAYVLLLGYFFEERRKQPYKKLNFGYFDSYKGGHNSIAYPYGQKDDMMEFRKRWSYTVIFHDMHYATEFSNKFIQETSERTTTESKLFSLGISNLEDLLLIPEMPNIIDFFRPRPDSRPFLHGDALMMIASRLAYRLDNYRADDIYSSLRQVLINSLKDGFWDHGLIGAIYSIRTYFRLLAQYVEKKPGHTVKPSLTSEINCFTDAISACAIHNLKHFKAGLFKAKFTLSHDRLPLAFTLILADEFQLWNRSLAERGPSRNNSGALQGAQKQKRDIFMIWDWLIRDWRWSGPASSKIELKQNGKIRIEIPFFQDYFGDSDFNRLVKMPATEILFKHISLNLNTKQDILNRVREYKFEYTNEKGVEEETTVEFRAAHRPPKHPSTLHMKDAGIEFHYDNHLRSIKEYWQEYRAENQSVCAFLDHFVSLEAGLLKILKANTKSGMQLRSAIKTIRSLLAEEIDQKAKLNAELFLPIQRFNIHDLKLTDPANPPSLKTCYFSEEQQIILDTLARLFDHKDIPSDVQDLFYRPEDSLLPSYSKLAAYLVALHDLIDLSCKEVE